MKNVLITGAGRGIGLALVNEFVRNDYKVIGTYRDASSAQELLKLAKQNPAISVVVADVSNSSTLKVLSSELKRIGSLDILINNSGVIGDRGRSLAELDMEKLEAVLQVNTYGPIRISQLALPFMKSGTVAQISSLMGSIADNGSGGYYDYRISKAALNMFNSCLSKEFPNITCLALHPGWVQTDMGGAGASVAVNDCAKGLYQVITSAKLKQSGRFFDYRGKELPW